MDRFRDGVLFVTPKGALAIFVKTPGLSPVKTRLAESIGTESADYFFKLSIAATTALMRALKGKRNSLQIYWAVAEAAGLQSECWNSFPVVFQGNGGLGDRLGRVYSTLLERHRFACLIGADSPHLVVDEIDEGFRRTQAHFATKFIIGVTDDGGFYFFGGGNPLPEIFWNEIEYSTNQTANSLIKGLSKVGKIELLPRNFDIDTVKDLRRYLQAGFEIKDFLPEQAELIFWAKSLLKKMEK